MKAKTRFIKSVIETARQNDTRMPWSRDTRRCASADGRIVALPRPTKTA